MLFWAFRKKIQPVTYLLLTDTKQCKMELFFKAKFNKKVMS